MFYVVRDDSEPTPMDEKSFPGEEEEGDRVEGMGIHKSTWYFWGSVRRLK